MTNTETKVKVSGIDRITGREEWESTIEKLLESRWPLDQDDIEKINSGETVKVYSENGRRCLDITKIN